MSNLFINKGKSIVCNTDLLIYIERSNCKETPEGDLDTFLFGAVVVAEDKGKLITKTLTLGTKVILKINSIEQIKVDENDSKHIVIEYREGDIIIEDRSVPKSIDNVEAMFKSLTGGHLSGKIPYYLYYDIINNNINTNENMGFPRILLELMLGELFVDDNDNKLRRTGADYGQNASIEDIIQTSGAFNSLIFRDADKSILINLAKSDEEQTQPSKLEKYFRK